jgi:hypothetical protein
MRRFENETTHSFVARTVAIDAPSLCPTRMADRTDSISSNAGNVLLASSCMYDTGLDPDKIDENPFP